MKKFFVKALAVLLVCMFVLSGINFSIFASNGSGNLGDKLAAVNVAVSGQVKMLFYFTNVDDVDYYEVSVDGERYLTKRVSNMPTSVKDGKTRYELEVPLAAAQQTSAITITPRDDEGNYGKTRTKSVREYVEKVLELEGAKDPTTHNGKGAEALKSMLNYGAMAQKVFGVNTGAYANAGLYFGNTNPVNNMSKDSIYGVKNYSCKATDSEVLGFYQANAYLEDVLSLRLYFKYNGNIKDLNVIIEGHNCGNEIYKDESGYYVKINNIPATKFNYQYTVIITDNTNTLALKYSVLNYVMTMLEKGDNTDQINTVKSMFQFYVKMTEYAKGEGSVAGKPEDAVCSHKRSYIDASRGLAEICSDCGRDITPTDLVANANKLANGVTAYYGTAAGVFDGKDDTHPTVDGARGNYIVENSNMNFHYGLSADGSQLATITNKNGGIYVQNTMDVYVNIGGTKYYASNSIASAKANLFRYGYYYYDAHMYGQNFLDKKVTVGDLTSTGTAKNVSLSKFNKSNHMTKPSVSSNVLSTQITNGSDPYIYFTDYVNLMGSNNALQIKMTTSSSTHVQLRYTTAYAGKFDDTNMVEFDVIADGKEHLYTIYLNTSKVFGMRLDFNGKKGETIKISKIAFVNVDKGSSPALLLDRGLHTYTDKMHQALSFVAPSGNVTATEVGMITNVTNVAKLYIKQTDGTVVESMTSDQTVNNVVYAGFYVEGVGVFGYILPADVDNNGDGVSDYNNGSISVYYDGTTYRITQAVTPKNNTILQQPAVNAGNRDGYKANDPTIGTSLNIYNSPSQFYFGQRIYTDTETTFDKFIAEAELERNPLGAENIKVNTDKTPGATFDGYDPIRGMYAFTIPDYIGFEDGYYRNQNFHGTVAFSITGDELEYTYNGETKKIEDRNLYVMAYTNGDTVEGGAVLDSNDNMLPIPTEVSKNFSHEFENVNFLWGDIGYSEVRIPVKVKAGETQELSVLHLFMNWGHKPLKQISSIQFFSPYYHLSTGTTETNCIANYYVHGKDLDTLPDHRAMSGTWWADDAAEKGDPQHDNAGFHNWMQYTVNGNKVTSEPIKSVITSSGPTYASIDMTYISDDGKIKVTYTHMEMPQVDETRTYYTMSYKILEDVTISDFANKFSFYSVYGYGEGYQKFGYYGAGGAQNNISADTKATYTLASADQHPYFDLYKINNTSKDDKGNTVQNKQNGNVSFLINDFSTTSAALQGANLIVRVENRVASLSLDADDVTLKAGETITINAIIMPWGTYASTDDQLVQNVRQNTLVNPFKATAHDSNTTVDTTKVFLPTVKSKDGVEATFSIGNGNGGNHSKGINVAFRADGFAILGVPKLLESTDGGANWDPVQVSSINNPDRSGSAHEYDGYAVHYNSDGTYSYSFVTTITGADRLFKVVVDDVSVEWTEDYGDSYFGPEALNKYANNGEYLTSNLMDGGAYITITNNNSADPYTASFALKPAPTARYLVLKYRMAEGVNTDLSFFVRTQGKIGDEVQVGDSKIETGNFSLSGSPIKKDGKWHVMVIDLAAIDSESNLIDLVPNANGTYTITGFRFDPFTTQSTSSYDIAYIAFCNNAQSVLDINPGVDAASIDHVTGRTKAPGSFKTVIDQFNSKSEYDSLNGVFAGVSLENAILTTGNKKYTTSLENGIVKFTKTESGESYFTVLFNQQGAEPRVTGQYLVMKYRTNCAALKSSNVYTGTEGYGATSDAQRLNGLNMIGDGQWHVAYYDLSAASSVVAAADGKYYVNFVRIDAGYHLAVGDSIEYAYIGICDDINKIPLEGGEFVEVNLNKANNADGVFADGNRGTNLSGNTIIDATTVQYDGWIGIAGKSVSKVSYVVTDMFGDKTMIDLAATSDASVANRYYDALSSQPHVDAVAGLGTGTVPYFVRFTADLSKWAGQTVTLSLVATVDSGAVQTWSIKVTVPVPEIEEPDEPGNSGWLDGEALLGALNTAQFSGTLNDDGYLTITNKADNADGALVLTNLANGLTPKYAVIKYKTTSAQNDLSMLATTGTNDIGGYVTSTVKTDGEWHTVLLDLRLCNGYNYGDNVKFMRLDVCEGAVGNNMTIDYVYLCENVDELSGIVVDAKHSNNNDYLYVDGRETNFKGSTSLNGTVIDYTGWVGVSGFASEGISYVVTDANGNETEVALMDSHTAVKRYYEDNGITTHLINNSKFSKDTKGYQVRFNADLSAWAGQTVTLSIRETITGGAIVETYSVQVTVPEGNFTITGADLKDFVITSMHNYTVNADDSITLTWKSGTDTYFNNFASLLSGKAAPRYAIVKYKTTTESSLVMLANTTGAAGPYVGTSTHTDGQWQYAIFDLTTVTNSAYTVGETVAFMRINCCDAAGDNLSIAQIEFCDDLGTSMFHRVFTDTFKVDGVESKGAMEVTGSKLHFGGWAGVNGRQATAISYVVTDKNGVETVVPCGGWNFNRSDLTPSAIGANYSAATKGFGGSVDADLSAWYGQTVTFSIRATLDNGKTVDFYSMIVNVPKSANPNYVTGSEMIAGLNNAGFSSTLNSDGSVTINCIAATDGTITFNSIMSGTPKYAVIRYKNTNTPQLVIYATTAGKGHKENYVTLQKDNAWHTVVVDLEAVGSYTAGDAINLLRFDFLDSGDGSYVGKSLTLDYVWFTDDLSGVEYDAYDKLDYVFVGQGIVDMATTGSWDNGIANAVVNADGTVTITSDGSGDSYFGHTLNGTIATGNYLVVKYRSGEGANVRGGKFNALAASKGNSWSVGGHIPMGYAVADHNWHILVINCADLASVTAIDGVYYMTEWRIDLINQFVPGSSIDFAYIGLCDDLNDIILEDGEYIEYAWQNFTTSMDTVKVDGTKVTVDSGRYSHMNDSEGASDRFNTFTGTTWCWEGGWFAVDNHALTNLGICVTDENGVEHWIDLPYSETSWVSGTWFVVSDITNHNINNNGYGANTLGYRLSNLTADLSAYAGQTVALSLRGITDSGRAVVIYSAFITVPAN